MAYEKQTWECGDIITAEKMNHMEDGIEGADPGYKCTNTETVLTEESVTTTTTQGASGAQFASGSLSYQEFLENEEITIVFNGTEYTCYKNDFLGANAYGGVGTSGPDFTEYPFCIASAHDSMGNTLLTQTAGTYSIKIGAKKETVVTTECFKKAVEMVSCFFVRVVFQGNDFVSMDKTFNDIANAAESMIPCFVVLENRDSFAPTQYYTLPIYGTRYSGFSGSYVYVSSGNDLRAEVVDIDNDGTVIKRSTNTPLNA